MKPVLWLGGLLLASFLMLVILSTSLPNLALPADRVEQVPATRHVSPMVQLPNQTGTTKLDDVFAPTKLKVPSPVLVTSLPKAGTTTAWQYFLCGRQPAAHQYARNETGAGIKIGQCMGENAAADRPVLQGCGSYPVLADIGAIWGSHCYYPSLHGLEDLYRDYPSATWLHIVRNASQWADSLLRYFNLAWKMSQKCTDVPKAPNNTRDDWAAFYVAHTTRIRDFASNHPSLTYIEVELESPATPAILQDRLGINASCWGVHNVNQQRAGSGT